MPTTAISRATLLNQGLSSSLLLNNTIASAAITTNAPIATSSATSGAANIMVDSDILGSYRSLINNSDFALQDPGLISVIGTAKTPLELATYFINGKYADLGGASGALGSTLTSVAATPGGTGFLRQFQNGFIYWHPLAGAHELHGPILVRWNALGGDKSFLGFPTTDVTVGSDVNAQGCYAHFQGGSIYWAPLPAVTDVLTGVTGISLASAATVPAATVTTPGSSSAGSTIVASSANKASVIAATGTAAKNVAAAATTGTTASSASSKAVSGPAVTNVGATAGATVGVNVGGLLQSSAGAFEVHGAIRDKYLALGAEASILGYPRTDETGTPDGIGRFNHFQGGSIYWTPNTSAHEVHGLIRDRWSNLGWETNPQLGYPISDELIPDPRVGHRRPETLKKPIASLPIDVVKLPAEAAASGFPSSVVNSATVTAASNTLATTATSVSAATTSSRVTTSTVAAKSSSTVTAANVSNGILGKLSDKTTVPAVANPIGTNASSTMSGTQSNVAISATIDPALLGSIILGNGPASTAGPRSLNRFADFESGVLFWARGATAATTLSPTKSTSDGTALSFAGSDIATAVVTKMGRASFESANMALTSMTFVGTTGYLFDGAQSHNRRHRLQMILHGTETPTILGLPLPPVTVNATVELQVEVWFDATQRRIALMPTDWSLISASTGSYGAAVADAMRNKLDTLLWSSYELITLPDTDGGNAIAVLSVKTLANGAVALFVEPHNTLIMQGISELANSVAPSVLVFSQPS